MRQHFHAARRGSQSAYKARPAAPDCNGRVQVHRERGRFKLATLKAIRELPNIHPATHRQRRGEVISKSAAQPLASCPLTFPNARADHEAGRAGESV
jgi:hypothetical protein